MKKKYFLPQRVFKKPEWFTTISHTDRYFIIIIRFVKVNSEQGTTKRKYDYEGNEEGKKEVRGKRQGRHTMKECTVKRRHESYKLNIAASNGKNERT